MIQKESARGNLRKCFCIWRLNGKFGLLANKMESAVGF